MEPLVAITLFWISVVQRSFSTNSFIKCLLIHINSPESTLLEYRLEVNASKVSLLPNIYAEDAVGIGAKRREFLMPYFYMSFLRESQSYILASTPHRSN